MSMNITVIETNSSAQPVDLTAIMAGSFKMNDNDDFYVRTANHVSYLLNKGVVFTTDAGITLKDLIEVLDEESQRYMNCRCCDEFIRRVGSLVYIDRETGRPKSVVWRDMSYENPDLVAAINSKLARRVEKANITGILTDFEHSKYTRNRMVGMATAGGFHHFHAEYEPNANLREAAEMFHSVRGSILARIADTGLDAINAAFKLILTKARLTSHFPAGHLHQLNNIAGMFAYMSKWKSEFKLDDQGAIYHYADLLADNVIFRKTWEVMEHFNGSSIGNMLKVVSRDHEQLDDAFRIYFKAIDPANFRVQEKELADEKELKAAMVYFDEHDLRKSFERRVAGVADVPGIWTATPNVEMDETDPFKQALAKVTDKKVEVKKVVMPDIQQITKAKFIAEVLPTALQVELKLTSHHDYPYTFSIPKDANAPAVFVWDTETNHRPDCTMVANEPETIRYYGLQAGEFIPVQKVITAPWTVGGLNTEGWTVDNVKACGSLLNAFSPFFLLVVEGKMLVEIAGINSYGAALKGELYQYRRAIDTAMQYLPMEQTNQAAVGFSLERIARTVRVTTADAIITYQVVDIE